MTTCPKCKCEFNDNEEFDKYHQDIISFVLTNPNCSQAEIVEAMYIKQTCSRLTTMKKIGELLAKNVLKNTVRGNGYLHSYVVLG